VSTFTNYFGLAMDAMLCVHCLKNYRDIYPSVFSIVMTMMVAGVQGSIKFDSLEAAGYFSLVMFVIMLLISCRYCYAGCNMGAACCKGGGLKFQFTCIGVGMCAKRAQKKVSRALTLAQVPHRRDPVLHH
jgi:hypothetical protein